MAAVLAISDSWQIGMWATSLGVSVLVVFVGGLTFNRVTKNFDGLKASLEKKAEELVDAKMILKTASLQSSIELLSLEFRNANARLEKGEGIFGTLTNADHVQELKNTSNLGELKLWVMQQAATKEELEGVIERVDKLHHLLAGGMVERIESAAMRMERAATPAAAGGGKRGG